MNKIAVFVYFTVKFVLTRNCRNFSQPFVIEFMKGNKSGMYIFINVQAVLSRV